MIRFAALVGALAASACTADSTEHSMSGSTAATDDASGPASDGTGEAPGTGGPSTTTSSSPAAPMILTFGTNTEDIQPAEPLTFAAVLTDPDGVDDIVGGVLVDPESGGTYGAFATTATEGAYEITVGWGEINIVRDINIPVPGAGRTFRAEFFDVAGHSVTRDTTIVLRCDLERNACMGRCDEIQDLDSTLGRATVGTNEYTVDVSCVEEPGSWQGRALWTAPATGRYMITSGANDGDYLHAFADGHCGGLEIACAVSPAQGERVAITLDLVGGQIIMLGSSSTVFDVTAL